MSLTKYTKNIASNSRKPAPNVKLKWRVKESSEGLETVESLRRKKIVNEGGKFTLNKGLDC